MATFLRNRSLFGSLMVDKARNGLPSRPLRCARGSSSDAPALTSELSQARGGAS
jgi:hypothetical protein